MELTQLRYFYQVYQSGSIHAAATALNVTQQAISRQVLKLETELGLRLFVRSARGVRPTSCGVLLAETVERFLPELDQFVLSAQRKSHGPTGFVRLGIQMLLMGRGGVLDYSVLRQFDLEYPGVRVLWENATPEMCKEGLLENRFDLCVMIMPPDPEPFVLQPLRDITCYLLMSVQNPLAKRPSVGVEDLSGQKVIFGNKDSVERKQIVQMLHGKVPPEFMDDDDFVLDSITQQIECENAVMLATDSLRGVFNPERFVLVPVKDKIWHERLYLASRKTPAPDLAVEVFRRFLIEHWAEGSTNRC